MTMSLRELNDFAEASEKSRDFYTLCLLLMRAPAGGSLQPFADSAPRRVATILKAAVDPGRLSDADWAGKLSDYRAIAEGFVESLRQASVFDRLLASGMRRMPFKTRTAVVTAAATGSVVAEGGWSPVTLMGIDGADTLDPRACQAIVALSRDLVRVGTPGAVDFLGRELRRAVVAATDRQMLTGLLAGVPFMFESVGQNASAAIVDLRNLVDALDLDANSRIFFVTTVANCKGLAFMRTTSAAEGDEAAAEGGLAFPQMTPLGGTIAGVPVLPTDQLADGHVMAIDASGLGGNSDIITLETASKGSLVLDTAPGSGAQQVISLFQNNLVALKAFRWFAFDKLRENAVAACEGAIYDDFVSQGEIGQSSGG